MLATKHLPGQHDQENHNPYPGKSPSTNLADLEPTKEVVQSLLDKYADKGEDYPDTPYPVEDCVKGVRFNEAQKLSRRKSVLACFAGIDSTLHLLFDKGLAECPRHLRVNVSILNEIVAKAKYTVSFSKKRDDGTIANREKYVITTEAMSNANRQKAGSQTDLQLLSPFPGTVEALDKKLEGSGIRLAVWDTDYLDLLGKDFRIKIGEDETRSIASALLTSIREAADEAGASETIARRMLKDLEDKREKIVAGVSEQLGLDTNRPIPVKIPLDTFVDMTLTDKVTGLTFDPMTTLAGNFPGQVFEKDYERLSVNKHLPGQHDQQKNGGVHSSDLTSTLNPPRGHKELKDFISRVCLITPNEANVPRLKVALDEADEKFGAENSPLHAAVRQAFIDLDDAVQHITGDIFPITASQEDGPKVVVSMFYKGGSTNDEEWNKYGGYGMLPWDLTYKSGPAEIKVAVNCPGTAYKYEKVRVHIKEENVPEHLSFRRIVDIADDYLTKNGYSGCVRADETDGELIDDVDLFAKRDFFIYPRDAAGIFGDYIRYLQDLPEDPSTKYTVKKTIEKVRSSRDQIIDGFHVRMANLTNAHGAMTYDDYLGLNLRDDAVTGLEFPVLAVSHAGRTGHSNNLKIVKFYSPKK